MGKFVKGIVIEFAVGAAGIAMMCMESNNKQKFTYEKRKQMAKNLELYNYKIYLLFCFTLQQLFYSKMLCNEHYIINNIVITLKGFALSINILSIFITSIGISCNILREEYPIPKSSIEIINPAF